MKMQNDSLTIMYIRGTFFLDVERWFDGMHIYKDLCLTMCIYYDALRKGGARRSNVRGERVNDYTYD